MSLFNTSYINVQPVACGSFIFEWQNCLTQLIEIKKDNRIGIFKLNLFVITSGQTDYREKKRIISDSLLNTLGEKCPAFGISANSPEMNYKVTAEIGLVNTSEIIINYRTWKDLRYTIIEKNGYKELWANGIESKLSYKNIKASAEKAFEIMHNILEAEMMSYNNIVRQWNYIGNILKTVRKGAHITQHYQVFNKVRSEYYRKYRTLSDFPAATGIGMKYGGVMIDFCAISGIQGMQIQSITNPRQSNPYNYDQNLLIGTPDKGQKRPPLFERAKILIYYNPWRLFVSGTASIIGQETSGIGSIEEQTSVTIENISKLVSRDNLLNHCPDLKYDVPLKYCRLRIYVKNGSDIPFVKSISANFYRNIPIIYIQADICRKDLLVEIEADLAS